MADVAHPIAEGATVGIETPDSDHDLARDLARQARAEQQDAHLVLRGSLHRLPLGGGGSAKPVDLGRRPPPEVAVEHDQLLLRRTVRPRRYPTLRQTLGAEFLSNVAHTNIACLP